MTKPNLSEFKPMHPGEFIKITFCEPLDIDIKKLSKMLNQDIKNTEKLLSGKTGVTPELATLLSKGLGRTRESWLKMQSQYDEYWKGSHSDVKQTAFK